MEKVKQLDKQLAKKTKEQRYIQMEIKNMQYDNPDSKKQNEKQSNGVFITENHNLASRDKSTILKPKFDIRRATSARSSKSNFKNKKEKDFIKANIEAYSVIGTQDNEKAESMLDDFRYSNENSELSSILAITDDKADAVEDSIMKQQKEALEKLNEKLREYHEPQEWAELSLINVCSEGDDDYLRLMQEQRKDKENLANIDNEIYKLKTNVNAHLLTKEKRDQLLEECKMRMLKDSVI